MTDKGGIDYPNASPTYRGYRRQALYVLHRILIASPEGRFQPEHREDLAVFDAKGNLQELVQVKDHTGPLQLSDLDPGGKSSFFARCADAIGEWPDIKLTLASYGTVGPELREAIEHDGEERLSVAQKITNGGRVDLKAAQEILGKLHLEGCREAALQEAVDTSLCQMVTAVDPLQAFDALMFWVFRRSEKSEYIVRQDVSKQIRRIGQFIGDVASHTAEWLCTICPIEDSVIEPSRMATLSAEFYEGVAARYEHIQADVDVVRPSLMQTVHEKLSARNVVFVHGASGQGKSTVAYRYLKDCCPGIARYRVKAVENAPHALRIARALGSHVSILGLPVTVYVDIPPQSEGWMDLIKELAFCPNIRVLATIREEDWRRANVSGADFRWNEVQMEFAEREARELFAHLTQEFDAPQFAGFDEAWERFGGEGPLLEFVHLVTRGGLLRERLKAQVEAIQSEVRREQRNDRELDLLRMVSVASTFGGRLKARAALEKLGFPHSGNPLNLLEEEYLLRKTDDGLLIEGLHPIRSRIIADLLCDPVTATWAESARECLPFVDDQRLETFLLGTFSEDVEIEEPLLAGLNSFEPTRWAQVASIARALLWLGVSRYARANLELVRHIEDELRLSWEIALDMDIAGLSIEEESPLQKLLAPEVWARIQELRRKQSPKEDVFVPLGEWLQSMSMPSEQPLSNEDWNGLAQIIYWNWRQGGILPILERFPWGAATAAINTLPVEILANLVVALHESCGAQHRFVAWFSENRGRLLDEFRRQTLTPKIEDDGEDKIEAHFIVRLDLWPDPQSPDFGAVLTSNPLHAEATYRLNILRKLIPDRERYGCRGYGHSIFDEALPIDETQKSGVLKEFLPIGWGVQLNSLFRGLVDYALRPGTWAEYAKEVVGLRLTIVEALDELTGALSTYFTSHDYIHVVREHLNAETLSRCCSALDWKPRLPQCAVDRFGFTSELNAKPTEKSQSGTRMPTFSMERYRPWKEALDRYTRAISGFMSQSVHCLAVMSAVGRSRNRHQSKDRIIQMARGLGLNDACVSLSITNLSSAFGSVPAFQDEFRRLLPERIFDENLTTLEHRERDGFDSLWALWYDFVRSPRLVIKKEPVRICRNKEGRLRTGLLRACDSQFLSLDVTGCSARIVLSGPRLDGQPAIWIVLDSETAISSHLASADVLTALRSACAKQTDGERLQRLLDREWSQIAVVPCVKGRPLIAGAWILLPRQLMEECELSSWDEMMRVVPEAMLENLGIRRWKLPDLEEGFAFLHAFVEFAQTAAHIRELVKIEDVDECGREVVCEYLTALEKEPLTNYQASIDAAEVMLNTFNGLPESDQEQRGNLAQCVVNLQKWWELAEQPKELDDGMLRIELSEISEWSPRLQEASQYAFLAYLFWADDVLEQHAASQDLSSDLHCEGNRHDFPSSCFEW
ncbi:MAG TPA: hypothetical protein PLO37_03555 [Candidatus Hydrogenedentes bacterium]|nr:hypothetical protein [Candidatus Hydrogenedentota bacterium]HPG65897.1 hypothetical protein [Candidatus Hydrogenedentota bacterium]